MTQIIFWVAAVGAILFLTYVAGNFNRTTLRAVTLVVLGAAALILVLIGPARGAANFGSYARGVVRSFWGLALGRHDLRFSTASWVALLVIGGIAYYALEALSAHRESPRVDVADPADSDGPETKLLLSELRFLLPAVSLRKPGTLPAATRPACALSGARPPMPTTPTRSCGSPWTYATVTPARVSPSPPSTRQG
jgi:hypothetical protein